LRAETVKAALPLFIENIEAFHYAVRQIRSSNSEKNQEYFYDNDEYAIDYAGTDGSRA
jgi:hypothetical protein